jgi:hypothetical protein
MRQIAWLYEDIVRNEYIQTKDSIRSTPTE